MKNFLKNSRFIFFAAKVETGASEKEPTAQDKLAATKTKAQKLLERGQLSPQQKTKLEDALKSAEKAKDAEAQKAADMLMANLKQEAIDAYPRLSADLAQLQQNFYASHAEALPKLTAARTEIAALKALGAQVDTALDREALSANIQAQFDKVYAAVQAYKPLRDKANNDLTKLVDRESALWNTENILGIDHKGLMSDPVEGISMAQLPFLNEEVNQVLRPIKEAGIKIRVPEAVSAFGGDIQK